MLFIRARLGLGLVVAVLGMVLQALAAPGGDQPLSAMDPLQAGQWLAGRLRDADPSEPMEVKGTIRIRRGAQSLRIPFEFRVLPGAGSWQSVYQTASVGDLVAEKLTIVHQPKGPNVYLLARGTGAGQAVGAPITVSNNQANISLASSDFWLTDLGLEFAQWPAQRYIANEMRKGRSCYILESINPDKSGKGYGKVVSWIDRETSGVILAEGYDPNGKLLKEFQIESVKKVQGQWQLQEMQISNVQIKSRTYLVFDYGGQGR